MLTIRGGIRQDATAKELLQEGREITAILSTSHKTAKENRRRKKAQAKAKLTKLPTAPFTKSI
jgi:phosphoribosylformimino-5-aminoimidazole carboxamide ribonucleotide (ProFAR) isomerase